MLESITESLRIINQILDAGNAVTAFSLLLYSLTFNPRELAARSFAMLLGCVAAVYFGDVLASTSQAAGEIEMWLRLEWVGIAFLPSAFLHLSDALLAATGRPSKGRRKLAVRISYVVSTIMFALAGLDLGIVNGLGRAGQTQYLQPAVGFWVFVLFLVFGLVFGGLNLYRAFQRCLTGTSRRRMAYLMFGSLGPILGGIPFLTLVGPTLSSRPILFQAALVLSNGSVAVLLVIMAYAVAYFGVSYPDRIVKSRLFQWIMRGPVVASTALAVTVIVGRGSELFGLEDSRLVPFSMVASILVLQYVITLVRPTIERWLFYGQDRDDIARLQLMEERLLTTGDVRQYLEAILNAVSDVSGASSAFIAAINEEGLDLEVAVGEEDPLRSGGDLPTIVVPENAERIEPLGALIPWDVYWLLPLHSEEADDVVGILGIDIDVNPLEFTAEEALGLATLADRAAVALTDRRLQREIFDVVDRLVPQVEEIQRIRAAAPYGGTDLLTQSVAGIHSEADLANLVKDALGHYWGGPRLMDSPLMGLRVVREAIREHGSPVNALRSILLQGIESVKPEGERRFTAEWMLYNILEMKFVEGRKVRDVAMRLAMSEADLYRKQRVAIEAVSRAVSEMEREAATRASEDGSQGS